MPGTIGGSTILQNHRKRWGKRCIIALTPDFLRFQWSLHDGDAMPVRLDRWRLKSETRDFCIRTLRDNRVVVFAHHNGTLKKIAYIEAASERAKERTSKQ